MMVSMTLVYLAMRGESFLYALLFTIVVHELYKVTVVVGNIYTLTTGFSTEFND